MLRDPLTADGAEIGALAASAALPAEPRDDGDGDGHDRHPRGTQQGHQRIMPDRDLPHNAEIHERAMT